jgi:hypothetical protein
VTINAGVTVYRSEREASSRLVRVRATNGSAAEIVVNGTLQVNGVEETRSFCAGYRGWQLGRIELPVATSAVNATYTIFTGSGEMRGGLTRTPAIRRTSRSRRSFLIAGSGSGTAVGAQLHLTDCYCFQLAGQEMNSKTNTWIDLKRTLMQRAITCGELNGSKVTIDRSA